MGSVFRCIWQLVSIKVRRQAFLPRNTKCIEDTAVDKLRNAVVIVCPRDDSTCGHTDSIE